MQLCRLLTIPASRSLKDSALVHIQAARKGGGERQSPLLCAAPQSLRDHARDLSGEAEMGSRNGGRLWSVQLSGLLPNCAINFLLINLVNSYKLITFWRKSDETRKFPGHVYA